MLVAGPWAESSRTVNASYLATPAMSLLWETLDEQRWAPVAAWSRNVLAALTATAPHLPPDWASVDAAGGNPRAQPSPAGDSPRYGYEAARVIVQAAVDCSAAGQGVAARAWPFLGGEVDGGDFVATYTPDGQRLGGERHPLALVAAAAAAAASGDAGRAARPPRRRRNTRRRGAQLLRSGAGSLSAACGSTPTCSAGADPVRRSGHEPPGAGPASVPVRSAREAQEHGVVLLVGVVLGALETGDVDHRAVGCGGHAEEGVVDAAEVDEQGAVVAEVGDGGAVGVEQDDEAVEVGLVELAAADDDDAAVVQRQRRCDRGRPDRRS